jgi:hypothetical protein
VLRNLHGYHSLVFQSIYWNTSISDVQITKNTYNNSFLTTNTTLQAGFLVVTLILNNAVSVYKTHSTNETVGEGRGMSVQGVGRGDSNLLLKHSQSISLIITN